MSVLDDICSFNNTFEMIDTNTDFIVKVDKNIARVMDLIDTYLYLTKIF